MITRSIIFSNARRFTRTLLTVLAWTPAFILFNEHVFSLAAVSGPSMYPFLNGDYHSSTVRDVVAMQLWKPRSRLKRGMVVCFWAPHDPNKSVIKRIVAMPGDTVLTREPYPINTIIVPEGHVWVEGDEGHRGTMDSNYYGPIPINLIFARSFAVVFPFRRAAWIRWEDYKGSQRVIPTRQSLWPPSPSN